MYQKRSVKINALFVSVWQEASTWRKEKPHWIFRSLHCKLSMQSQSHIRFLFLSPSWSSFSSYKPPTEKNLLKMFSQVITRLGNDKNQNLFFGRKSVKRSFRIYIRRSEVILPFSVQVSLRLYSSAGLCHKKHLQELLIEYQENTHGPVPLWSTWRKQWWKNTSKLLLCHKLFTQTTTENVDWVLCSNELKCGIAKEQRNWSRNNATMLKPQPRTLLILGKNSQKSNNVLLILSPNNFCLFPFRHEFTGTSRQTLEVTVDAQLPLYRRGIRAATT